MADVWYGWMKKCTCAVVKTYISMHLVFFFARNHGVYREDPWGTWIFMAAILMKSVDQVVVLSGSMEPGLQRGDILFLGCTACACYVAMVPPPLGSRMVKGIHFYRDTASRFSTWINLRQTVTWKDLESASSWFCPPPESNAFARQVSYSLFRAAIISVTTGFLQQAFAKCPSALSRDGPVCLFGLWETLDIILIHVDSGSNRVISLFSRSRAERSWRVAEYRKLIASSSAWPLYSGTVSNSLLNPGIVCHGPRESLTLFLCSFAARTSRSFIEWWTYMKRQYTAQIVGVPGACRTFSNTDFCSETVHICLYRGCNNYSDLIRRQPRCWREQQTGLFPHESWEVQQSGWKACYAHKRWQ